MAAHLFGYVGEVNDAMVAADDGLKSGDLVGQAGIEKIYNPMLMGKDGAKVVVVNSLGREIRTLEEVAPTEGKRLQLTIDYDLQKSVDDAFKAARQARLTNAGRQLGHTSLTIPAGSTRTLTIGLNRAGRRLRAKHHKLTVTLTIVLTVGRQQSTITSQTLTL